MLIYSINKYLFSNYCPNLGSSESRAWPEIKASMLPFFQGVKSHREKWGQRALRQEGRENLHRGHKSPSHHSVSRTCYCLISYNCLLRGHINDHFFWSLNKGELIHLLLFLRGEVVNLSAFWVVPCRVCHVNLVTLVTALGRTRIKPQRLDPQRIYNEDLI